MLEADFFALEDVQKVMDETINTINPDTSDIPSIREILSQHIQTLVEIGKETEHIDPDQDKEDLQAEIKRVMAFSADNIASRIRETLASIVEIDHEAYAREAIEGALDEMSSRVFCLAKVLLGENSSDTQHTSPVFH